MKTLKFLAIIFLLSACNLHPQQAESTSAHWTYEGEEGPEYWGELDSKYTVCGTGTHQSPIDISTPNEKDLANIVFHYESSQVNILNNGHTVQVNYDAGSYIELDSVYYDLLQFHYHAPSEHVIDGKSFPAEIHLVHKNAEGGLAVVGILLQVGAENEAYQPFIENLPAEKSDVQDVNASIDAEDLLPTLQTTFRYAGSLTTPPCTEGVSWLVMTNPVELSAEQLDKLETLFEGNNRPVQEINDRLILEDNTP